MNNQAIVKGYFIFDKKNKQVVPEKTWKTFFKRNQDLTDYALYENDREVLPIVGNRGFVSFFGYHEGFQPNTVKISNPDFPRSFVCDSFQRNQNGPLMLLVYFMQPVLTMDTGFLDNNVCLHYETVELSDSCDSHAIKVHFERIDLNNLLDLDKQSVTYLESGNNQPKTLKVLVDDDLIQFYHYHFNEFNLLKTLTQKNQHFSYIAGKVNSLPIGASFLKFEPLLIKFDHDTKSVVINICDGNADYKYFFCDYFSIDTFVKLLNSYLKNFGLSSCIIDGSCVKGKHVLVHQKNKLVTWIDTSSHVKIGFSDGRHLTIKLNKYNDREILQLSRLIMNSIDSLQK